MAIACRVVKKKVKCIVWNALQDYDLPSINYPGIMVYALISWVAALPTGSARKKPCSNELTTTLNETVSRALIREFFFFWACLRQCNHHPCANVNDTFFSLPWIWMSHANSSHVSVFNNPTKCAHNKHLNYFLIKLLVNHHC